MLRNRIFMEPIPEGRSKLMGCCSGTGCERKKENAAGRGAVFGLREPGGRVHAMMTPDVGNRMPISIMPEWMRKALSSSFIQQAPVDPHSTGQYPFVSFTLLSGPSWSPKDILPSLFGRFRHGAVAPSRPCGLHAWAYILRVYLEIWLPMALIRYEHLCCRAIFMEMCRGSNNKTLAMHQFGGIGFRED